MLFMCTYQVDRDKQADTQAFFANMTEEQIAGEHYKNQKIQPLEYILANDMPFIEGNIVKYISRWRDKGGIQDLKKVKHYTEILMEYENAKGK